MLFDPSRGITRIAMQFERMASSLDKSVAKCEQARTNKLDMVATLYDEAVSLGQAANRGRSLAAKLRELLS
jgi:exonuclease VII small subunit